MSTINISQYLAPDVAEIDVDKIGRSLLVELARAQRLRVVGEVERTGDEFVVGVAVTGPDGSTALAHVPMSDPRAKGKTTPDARRVSWQVEVEPRTADPAVLVVGQVGNDGYVHGLLPAQVVEHGGMITFRHGLPSSDVLITAYAADGTEVGYESAIEITRGEHQMQMPPGASHLSAVIDDEETR